jgi:hypothetical protein
MHSLIAFPKHLKIGRDVDLLEIEYLKREDAMYKTIVPWMGRSG